MKNLESLLQNKKKNITTISFTTSEEVKIKLKELAKEHKVPVSTIISTILEDYFKINNK